MAIFSLYFTSIQVEQKDTNIKQIVRSKLKIYQFTWIDSVNFREIKTAIKIDENW